MELSDTGIRALKYFNDNSKKATIREACGSDATFESEAETKENLLSYGFIEKTGHSKDAAKYLITQQGKAYLNSL